MRRRQDDTHRSQRFWNAIFLLLIHTQYMRACQALNARPTCSLDASGCVQVSPTPSGTAPTQERANKRSQWRHLDDSLNVDSRSLACCTDNFIKTRRARRFDAVHRPASLNQTRRTTPACDATTHRMVASQPRLTCHLQDMKQDPSTPHTPKSLHPRQAALRGSGSRRSGPPQPEILPTLRNSMAHLPPATRLRGMVTDTRPTDP